MTNIFVTSDTHFNHANILKFTDYSGNKVRDFSSVEEMNETLITRWNSVVKPGDKIYHLGDVFFGPKKWIEENWHRLNGRKRLIVGNHDDIPYMVNHRMFEKVDMWRMFSEYHLLLSHVPVHDSVLGERGKTNKKLINVHGHIHTNASPSPFHRNVSTEVTNYYPISIEELKAND
ncbi:COG4186 Predicted phosphoesterase or phosphohydrolase [uncultured Caudovirales phage]|uniref:COG4186 Predicted phosphoesterase or phosphohydrolase n=1 Tax=uncultured Caudovirales phage TaxID=2100421 RepID=A0A6J5NXM1_9CAUD|nr:COG4186 Predicted phosphoesterase or phosphohydrolase [uncultured Caudovirales phage]